MSAEGIDLDTFRSHAAALFEAAGVLASSSHPSPWIQHSMNCRTIGQGILRASEEIAVLRGDVERAGGLVDRAAESLAARVKYSNGLERAATRAVEILQKLAANEPWGYQEAVDACKALEAAILDVPAAAGPRA